MKKYYEPTKEEFNEYLEIKLENSEQVRGIISWFQFRIKHPFISYHIQEFLSFIVNYVRV